MKSAIRKDKKRERIKKKQTIKKYKKKGGFSKKRRVGIFGDNKSITSKSGQYVHTGSDGEPLICFQCKGRIWKVNSYAFGGKFADFVAVDWMTDKTHYAYTCESCGEVRFKRWPLIIWERHQNNNANSPNTNINDN